MAYNTATIVQVDPPDIKGNVHVVIQYTGNAGEPPVNDDFFFNNTVDPTQIRQQVSSRVTALNNFQTSRSNLTVGATIPVTPPTTTQPTTLQADSTQFQQDWLRWQQIEKAISNQLLTGSEPQVTAFKTKVTNEFQQVITDAQAAGQTQAQAWITALNLL